MKTKRAFILLFAAIVVMSISNFAEARVPTPYFTAEPYDRAVEAGAYR